MPEAGFTAKIADGWHMFLLFEAQWNEWVKDPGSLRKALLSTILGNHVLDWTWHRNCDITPQPDFMKTLKIIQKSEDRYTQFRRIIFEECNSTEKLYDIANGIKHANLHASNPRGKEKRPARTFDAGISDFYLPAESFPDFTPEQAQDLSQFTYLEISVCFTDDGSNLTKIETIGPVLKDALEFWHSFCLRNLPHRAAS